MGQAFCGFGQSVVEFTEKGTFDCVGFFKVELRLLQFLLALVNLRQIRVNRRLQQGGVWGAPMLHLVVFNNFRSEFIIHDCASVVMLEAQQNPKVIVDLRHADAISKPN